MAAKEKSLDKSEFYHSALDTLMHNLNINSTATLESSRWNNSIEKHFHSIDDSKFFSFCSTIKRESVKKQNDDADNKSVTPNVRETPKRLVTATRKQKLFASTEGAIFKPISRSSLKSKELSPQSLLLKKAITQLECMQRRQERMALSKKPTRTSLRI